MTEQLNLFSPIADVVPLEDREAYGTAFHAANPHVMELLARLTRRMRARSGGHIGFRAVWEHARWMYRYRTRDASGWKLNNNLQAWYSRELMARYVDLAGAFHTRERAA